MSGRRVLLLLFLPQCFPACVQARAQFCVHIFFVFVCVLLSSSYLSLCLCCHVSLLSCVQVIFVCAFFLS